MPCYHPIPGWLAKSVNKSGKRSVVFNVSEGYKDKVLSVPCGKCIGCRLERSRQWAVRCMHEAKLWERNCFVTLTYEDEKLPADGSLRPRDFVLFMKRLRARFGAGIRFFHCGEYGLESERPHHHCLLFNHDFDDRVFYRGGQGGDSKLYTSKECERLWGHGFCTIGDASYESAGYIARYSLKKVYGPAADGHYKGRVPEYLTMSRRPGIGSAHARRFLSDWYPSDEVIVNGSPTKPPRYYDGILEGVDAEALRKVKARRVAAALSDADATGSRLIVREEVKLGAIRNLGKCESVKVVQPGPLPEIAI